MSAAQRVLESLKKLGHKVKERKISRETLAHEEEQTFDKGVAVMQKLAEAFEIFRS
jgi:branched-subunit amino acid aminotransferase/4-amino-4-deoxychorismate lyase